MAHRHVRCRSQNTLRDKSTRDAIVNVLGIIEWLRLEKTSKAVKSSLWPSTTKPHCKEWEFASTWNVCIPWQHIPHTSPKVHLKQKQVQVCVGMMISVTVLDDSYCTWNWFVTREKWKTTSKIYISILCFKKDSWRRNSPSVFITNWKLHIATFQILRKQPFFGVGSSAKHVFCSHLINLVNTSKCQLKKNQKNPYCYIRENYLKLFEYFKLY